jgi:hypothetical protein
MRRQPDRRRHKYQGNRLEDPAMRLPDSKKVYVSDLDLTQAEQDDLVLAEPWRRFSDDDRSGTGAIRR